MQNTSNITNWDTIIASDDHWFESALDIYTTESHYEFVGEAKLFSMSTSSEMFTTTPVIGKAIAGEIDAQLLMPTYTIPTMAKIIPYVRVKNATLTSGWLPQGVFYVDTRQVTHNQNGLDILYIHGYDAMLKAEQDWYDKSSLNWSSGTVSDIQMVNEIAAIMGVSVDSRTTTIMNKNYRITMPTSYSCREVLSYIASMYVGCFIMTETGALRLVTLTELPAETNLLIDSVGARLVFGTTRILV